MGKVRFYISISLDGFTAGPNQSLENPLGLRGEELHEWVVRLDVWRRAHGLEGGDTTSSSHLVEENQANVGAIVMGRNMFGGGPGPWATDDEWKGWWGDDPPYHVPVFVITHHPREPLEMEGNTTFFFVTDGVGSAVKQAQEAAGDRDVLVAGGANVIQQCLSAGMIDEFELHVVPILLGAGERLFENVTDPRLEQVRSVEGEGVTHIKYRVIG